MKNHEGDWKKEFESHLTVRAGHGATPEKARRRFGNRLQISEAVRAVHVTNYVDRLLQDFRYAARTFSLAPLFTVVAILTLALGFGASTAVFSVVDRILFRPLPYAQPDGLVWLGMAAPIEANEFLLNPDILSWKKSQTVFTHLTADNPVRLRCAQVDDNFLSTFGDQPFLYRDLTESDDAETALISRLLWQSRYAPNPVFFDTTIQINRNPIRIVGVLPPSFELPTL